MFFRELCELCDRTDPIYVNTQSTDQNPGWAADLRSGFLVFLIALPLCLGIAMASAFPPIAGVLTAIVGGVVVSFLGSSRLTIKGPAAGLIVIALGCVQELGGGDLQLGYRRALAVGVAAAALQIILALVRTATVGIAMSPSVVHGMLAAIGIIIMAKQSHVALGVKPSANEPLELIAELPHSLMHANAEIAIIGAGSLLILFLHPFIKLSLVKMVPAQVFVLLFAVPLGLFFDMDHAHNYRMFAHDFHVGPEYLVSLPASILDGITFPDFSVVFTGASIKYIIMFALVGSIESVLSVLAVDSLDPRKSASNLNKDLLGVGVGNLICGMIGGLPMISEIVRSKANIDAGARSARSNFAHGALLLAAVGLIPSVLHQIPLAALAAMLVFTGSRLASPGELIHAKALGRDQLLLFTTTLVMTLATDLLIGVGVGLALKVTLHWARGASVRTLWGSSVEASREQNRLLLKLHGAATFSILLKVKRALDQVNEEIEVVEIDMSDTSLIDHTFLSRVRAISNEWTHTRLEFVGMDGHRPVSPHPFSTRRKNIA